MVVSCFSVGGYMLIETGFKSSLQREIEAAYQESDILVSSFGKDSLIPYGYNSDTDNESIVQKENTKILQGVMATLTIQNFGGNISFCLRDKKGQLIYQNGGFYNDSELVEKVDSKTRGYKVTKDKGKYKMYVLRELEDMENIYIENARDISPLFVEREERYQIFLYCMALLSLMGAVVVFVVTRWLVNPINKLSKATKQIATTGYSEEIIVGSNDEIGQLTKDFNTMSKRLMTTMEELQDALNRQEVFVGNFAHELKTPLTSMIGYGDMLRSKKLSNDQVIDFANLIVQEGKRLEVMSMKLMQLIVLKKQDFIFDKIDAELFFDEIKAVLEPIIENSNIDFEMNVESGVIIGEADLLKTVCLNLLDNARKAIDGNGKIEFLGKKSDDSYHVIVKDNGWGIDEEEIDKIKEAFYMVDKSRSRSVGGAGLGLAICDQIVKLHHGEIVFESEKGQGTTVTVVIEGGGNVAEN